MCRRAIRSSADQLDQNRLIERIVETHRENRNTDENNDQNENDNPAFNDNDNASLNTPGSHQDEIVGNLSICLDHNREYTIRKPIS